MIMASPWWWPFRARATRDECVVKQELDHGKDLRHDLAGKQEIVGRQTELLRRILDPIEADLNYQAVTGRGWRHDNEPGDDNPGGGVRGGDSGDV